MYLRGSGFNLLPPNESVPVRDHPFITFTREDESGSRERMRTEALGQLHVDVHIENLSPLTSSCLLLMQKVGVFKPEFRLWTE